MSMWNVLLLYGVSGELLNVVRSFYSNSKACIRLRNELNEYFLERISLRQECVVSMWLFNLYMNSLVR